MGTHNDGWWAHIFFVARWYKFSWKRFSTTKFLLNGDFWHRITHDNDRYRRMRTYYWSGRASFRKYDGWSVLYSFCPVHLVFQDVHYATNRCCPATAIADLRRCFSVSRRQFGHCTLLEAAGIFSMLPSIMFFSGGLIFHSWLTVASFGLILSIVLHYPCQVFFLYNLIIAECGHFRFVQFLFHLM